MLVMCSLVPRPSRVRRLQYEIIRSEGLGTRLGHVNYHVDHVSYHADHVSYHVGHVNYHVGHHM